jgi:hypothetical protein
MDRKRQSPGRVRRLVPSIAALLTALLYPVPGRADIIITVQSVSVFAGSSGNVLDVTLQNTGPSAVTVGSFLFEINTADTDIFFSSASTATIAPYIFFGDSLFGPLINTDSGQTLDASDASASGFGASLGSGATVGLGEITFDVASGDALGLVAVSLIDSGTSLSDPDGDTLPIDSLVSGQITIDAGPVPEPGSALLVAGALLWLALRSVRFAHHRPAGRYSRARSSNSRGSTRR